MVWFAIQLNIEGEYMNELIKTVDLQTAQALIKIGDDLTLQSPEWDEFVFTKEGYLDLKNTIDEREDGNYRKEREVTTQDTDILYGNKVIEYCKTCHLGKITVYTKLELNEAVKQEREECALICDRVADKYLDSARGHDSWDSANECGEAIRQRGKE